MQTFIFLGALIALSVSAPQNYNYKPPQTGATGSFDLRQSRNQQRTNGQTPLNPSSSSASQSQFIPQSSITNPADNAPSAPSFEESLAATLPQESANAQDFNHGQDTATIGVPLPSFNSGVGTQNASPSNNQQEGFGLRVADQQQGVVGRPLAQIPTSFDAQENLESAQGLPSQQQAGFSSQGQILTDFQVNGNQFDEVPQINLQLDGQGNFGDIGVNQINTPGQQFAQKRPQGQGGIGDVLQDQFLGQPQTNLGAQSSGFVGQVGQNERRPQHSPALEKDYGPAKYDFKWDVNDVDSGNFYGHEEERDGAYTQGRYYVRLPDTRLMTVEYYADETGYHPTVTFEGEAVYDEVLVKGQFGQSAGGQVPETGLNAVTNIQPQLPQIEQSFQQQPEQPQQSFQQQSGQRFQEQGQQSFQPELTFQQQGQQSFQPEQTFQQQGQQSFQPEQAFQQDPPQTFQTGQAFQQEPKQSSQQQFDQTFQQQPGQNFQQQSDQSFQQASQQSFQPQPDQSLQQQPQSIFSNQPQSSIQQQSQSALQQQQAQQSFQQQSGQALPDQTGQSIQQQPEQSFQQQSTQFFQEPQQTFGSSSFQTGESAGQQLEAGLSDSQIGGIEDENSLQSLPEDVGDYDSFAPETQVFSNLQSNTLQAGSSGGRPLSAVSNLNDDFKKPSSSGSVTSGFQQNVGILQGTGQFNQGALQFSELTTDSSSSNRSGSSFQSPGIPLPIAQQQDSQTDNFGSQQGLSSQVEQQGPVQKLDSFQQQDSPNIFQATDPQTDRQPIQDLSLSQQGAPGSFQEQISQQQEFGHSTKDTQVDIQQLIPEINVQQAQGIPASQQPEFQQVNQFYQTPTGQSQGIRNQEQLLGASEGNLQSQSFQGISSQGSPQSFGQQLSAQESFSSANQASGSVSNQDQLGTSLQDVNDKLASFGTFQGQRPVAADLINQFSDNLGQTPLESAGQSGGQQGPFLAGLQTDRRPQGLSVGGNQGPQQLTQLYQTPRS